MFIVVLLRVVLLVARAIEWLRGVLLSMHFAVAIEMILRNDYVDRHRWITSFVVDEALMSHFDATLDQNESWLGTILTSGSNSESREEWCGTLASAKGYVKPNMLDSGSPHSSKMSSGPIQPSLQCHPLMHQ